jgi:hypothetical protein
MSAVDAVVNTATRTTPRRSTRTSSGSRSTPRACPALPAQAGLLLRSGEPLPCLEAARTGPHRVGPPAVDISAANTWAAPSAAVSRP